mmetsp:Transcript_3994/g.11602  ORF Transcript_3994/g.11602 Transcript_3994/m.11602 type:complete len:237 (+) Transcript_3994:1361-2071(+)
MPPLLLSALNRTKCSEVPGLRHPPKLGATRRLPVGEALNLPRWCSIVKQSTPPTTLGFTWNSDALDGKTCESSLVIPTSLPLPTKRTCSLFCLLTPLLAAEGFWTSVIVNMLLPRCTRFHFLAEADPPPSPRKATRPLSRGSRRPPQEAEPMQTSPRTSSDAPASLAPPSERTDSYPSISSCFTSSIGPPGRKLQQRPSSVFSTCTPFSTSVFRTNFSSQHAPFLSKATRSPLQPQ